MTKVCFSSHQLARWLATRDSRSQIFSRLRLYFHDESSTDDIKHMVRKLLMLSIYCLRFQRIDIFSVIRDIMPLMYILSWSVLVSRAQCLVFSCGLFRRRELSPSSTKVPRGGWWMTHSILNSDTPDWLNLIFHVIGNLFQIVILIKILFAEIMLSYVQYR